MFRKLLTNDKLTVVLILVFIIVCTVMYATSTNFKFTVPAGAVIKGEVISIDKDTLTANILNTHTSLNAGLHNRFERDFIQFLSEKDCKLIVFLTSESANNNTRYLKHINIHCNGKPYPLKGFIYEPGNHTMGINKPIHMGQRFNIGTTDSSDW